MDIIYCHIYIYMFTKYICIFLTIAVSFVIATNTTTLCSGIISITITIASPTTSTISTSTVSYCCYH